jgi:hypothetical protein
MIDRSTSPSLFHNHSSPYADDFLGACAVDMCDDNIHMYGRRLVFVVVVAYP